MGNKKDNIDNKENGTKVTRRNRTYFTRKTRTRMSEKKSEGVKIS